MLRERLTAISRYLAAMGAIAVASCGGGGDGGPKSQTDQRPARFIDASVQGLSCQSGSTTTTTDALGSFKYQVDVPYDSRGVPNQALATTQSVTCSFGDVALPVIPPIATPAVANNSNQLHVVFDTAYVSPYTASSDPVAVSNMRRVLMMVDSDGNPNNGIQVSPQVQAAKFGLTVNWSAADLPTEVASLQGQLRSLDGGTHELPSADAAAAHADPAWNCAMLGRYTGNVKGSQFTDTSGKPQMFAGTWKGVVLPPSGEFVGALTFSTRPDSYRGEFRFSGGELQAGASPTATSTSVQYVDSGQYATQVSPQIPLSVTGTFNGGGTPSGTWTGTDGSSGTFDGNRAGTTFEGNYRFMLYPIYVKHPSYATNGVIFQDVLDVELGASGNSGGYLEEPGSPEKTSPAKGTFNPDNTISLKETYSDGTVRWKFDGVFDPATVTLTGTFDAYDGTHLVFDSKNRIEGCEM